MSIRTFCPACKARVNAPDGAAGKTLVCPRCKAPVPVAPPVRASPFGAAPSPNECRRRTQLAHAPAAPHAPVAAPPELIAGPSRRALRLGVLAAAAALAGLAVGLPLAAVALFGSQTSEGPTEAAQPATPDAFPTAAVPTVESGGDLLAGRDRARHGDAILGVERVRVGKARLTNDTSGMETLTEEECLAITLALENTSRDRFLPFPGWGKKSFGINRYARLADTRGNAYRPCETFGNYFVGAAEDNRLRPGQTSTDVVAFEAPLPTAADLLLTVVVPRHGDVEAKSVRFRIPAELWKKTPGD